MSAATQPGGQQQYMQQQYMQQQQQQQGRQERQERTVGLGPEWAAVYLHDTAQAGPDAGAKTLVGVVDHMAASMGESADSPVHVARAVLANTLASVSVGRFSQATIESAAAVGVPLPSAAAGVGAGAGAGVGAGAGGNNSSNTALLDAMLSTPEDSPVHTVALLAKSALEDAAGLAGGSSTVEQHLGGVLDGDIGSWLDAYAVPDPSLRLIKMVEWLRMLRSGSLPGDVLERVAVAYVRVASAYVLSMWQRFRVRPVPIIVHIIEAMDALDRASRYTALATVADEVSHRMYEGWLHELHPLAIRNRILGLGAQIMCAVEAEHYTDALLQWTRLEGEEEVLGDMVSDSESLVSSAACAIKVRYAMAIQSRLSNRDLATDGKALALLTSAVLTEPGIQDLARDYQAFATRISRSIPEFTTALLESEASVMGAHVAPDLIAWQRCPAQSPDALVAAHDLEYVYANLIFPFIVMGEFLAADLLIQATLDRIASDIATGTSIERGSFASLSEVHDRGAARRARVRGIRTASSVAQARTLFYAIHNRLAQNLEDERHPLVHMALVCFNAEPWAPAASARQATASLQPGSFFVSVEWYCAGCATFFPCSYPFTQGSTLCGNLTIEGVHLCSLCSANRQ